MSAAHRAPDEAVVPPCATSPKLFTPPEGEREPSRVYRESQAVRLCRTGNKGRPCPILQQCALTDLFTDTTTVRGGLTTPERDELRKQHAKDAGVVLTEWDDCGTQAAYSRHKRRGTPVCEDCRIWARERSRTMRAKKMEAAA